MTKSIIADIQHVHIILSSFMKLVVLTERETENEKYFIQVHTRANVVISVTEMQLLEAFTQKSSLAATLEAQAETSVKKKQENETQ